MWNNEPFLYRKQGQATETTESDGVREKAERSGQAAWKKNNKKKKNI